jgi:hypothetical protein
MKPCECAGLWMLGINRVQENNMLKRWFIGASAMLMLVGVGAQAAAPELPAGAISKNTTIVAYFDGATLTPDAMREAAATVLGPNSPAVAQLNQTIGKYQEKHDKAVQAGADSIVMVAQTGGAAQAAGHGAAAAELQNQGVMYVHVRKGAHNAVEKMISDEMEPAEREKTTFSHEGDFVVMRQKGQKPAELPDPARAKTFADALAHNSTAALVVTFVPDDSTRQAAQNQQAGNQPQWMRDAVPVLANSQWSSVAVQFGKMPAIVMTDQAADAASATKLTNAVNAALAQLKQVAQNANAGGAGGGNAMMMFAPMLAPLADALKPTQQGSTVVINLNGQGLATIATTVAQFAPMLGAMGGRPGAAPRGGRPAPGAGQ